MKAGTVIIVVLTKCLVRCGLPCKGRAFFLSLQLVKNLPAMQETRVRSLGWEGRSAGEGRGYLVQNSWTSLVTQLVKNLPTMLETWVPSLGWEDPLEKGTAAHSSILGWRIRPWGRKELDMTERLSL